MGPMPHKLNVFQSEFNFLVVQTVESFTYNRAFETLLIYGPQGVGKTEMLKTLYRKQKHLGPEVIWVDALSFAREYAFAAQELSLVTFRKNYRSAKILFVDNLNLLAGKERTIEELLFTYEHIIGQGGKVIASLEGSLNVEFLGQRLASRFLSGIVLPIHPPKTSELRKFVEYFVNQKRLIVEAAVLNEISEKSKDLTQVKEILTGFVKYAEQEESALTVPVFQRYWLEVEKTERTQVSVNNILQVTAEITGIKVEEILNGGRKQPNVAEARRLAIYTTRLLCKLSYAQIGQIYKREHNSILRTCRLLEEELKKNNDLRGRFQAILKVFSE